MRHNQENYIYQFGCNESSYPFSQTPKCFNVHVFGKRICLQTHRTHDVVDYGLGARENSWDWWACSLVVKHERN